MKLKELLTEGKAPSTVISAIASYDLDTAIELLKKKGFKAKKYDDEYIGIYGDNSSNTKKKMDRVLKNKLSDNHYEISESIINEGFSANDYNKMMKRLSRMATYRDMVWDYMEENFKIKSVNRRKEDLELIIEDLTDKQIAELIKLVDA